MATVNQESQKQHLKLAILGSTDSGKTTLGAGIVKTLHLYQCNLQISSLNLKLQLNTNFTQFNISNRAAYFTIETFATGHF